MMRKRPVPDGGTGGVRRPPDCFEERLPVKLPMVDAASSGGGTGMMRKRLESRGGRGGGGGGGGSKDGGGGNSLNPSLELVTADTRKRLTPEPDPEISLEATDGREGAVGGRGGGISASTSAKPSGLDAGIVCILATDPSSAVMSLDGIAETIRKRPMRRAMERRGGHETTEEKSRSDEGRGCISAAGGEEIDRKMG